MNHPLHLLTAITATAALGACGNKALPPPATDVSPSASSTAPPPAASMPPAIPAQPPTGTNPAETSKDSAATNPKGTGRARASVVSVGQAWHPGPEAMAALPYFGHRPAPIPGLSS